jgi:hypothetical protein
MGGIEATLRIADALVKASGHPGAERSSKRSD